MNTLGDLKLARVAYIRQCVEKSSEQTLQRMASMYDCEIEYPLNRFSIGSISPNKEWAPTTARQSHIQVFPYLQPEFVDSFGRTVMIAACINRYDWN